MTQQEIQELAGHRQVPAWVMKLVGDAVAKEREAWSKVCEDIRKVFNEKADLAYIAGQKEEREACAMLCLWHNNKMSQTPTLFHMAELIRARGHA